MRKSERKRKEEFFHDEFSSKHEYRIKHSPPVVDSAPGHQETLKPPLGGFFI
jgi:hypothetical protein